MSWTKLSDTIIDHPKFVDLHDAGWSLFIRALVWSSKHRTEGLLARTVVERLGAKRAVIRELVTRRIWEPRAGGAYQIHDFLDYNLDRHGGKPPPTPELRAVRAEAGRRGGVARWHGKARGKPASPAMANLPLPMAPVATPEIPRSRDPGEENPRRPAAAWTPAGEYFDTLRDRFAPPDPEDGR